MPRPKTALPALILTALLAACGGAPAAPPPSGGQLPGGGAPGAETGDALPAQLQGEWHHGSVSPIEYYDPSSGKWAEASGTSIILKLAGSGTYEQTGIMVVTTGNCTSKLVSRQTGVVKLAGDRLTLVPKAAYAKGYTCTPANAYETTTARDSVNTWEVTGSGADAVLALGDPAGQARDSLYNRPRGASAPGPGPGGPGPAQGTISGRLTLAPGAGSMLGDIVVMACPVDGGCANQAKWRFAQLATGATSAAYTISNVLNEPYRVYAWNDLNSNRTPDGGDLIGVYTTDGTTEATVIPPAQNINLTVERAG